MNQVLNSFIFNNLRILKGRNKGDLYYEEYLKHHKREGDVFYDQYHYAVERVLSHKPSRILEIGIRTGLCVCNMLSAYIDHSNIERIVLIDLWNDGYTGPGIVKMNLKTLNIPQDVIDKIEFITGDSKVEVPKLEGEFDYILVDGDHEKEASRLDLENVVRLCAPGGVIVFDDLTPHGCNLQDVWDGFKLSHNMEFDFGENHDGKGVGYAVKKV